MRSPKPAVVGLPAQQIVLVLVPMEFGFARDVIRGVRTYAAERGGWALRCGSMPAPEKLPALTKSADGAVVFLGDNMMSDAARGAITVPLVNTSSRSAEPLLPAVRADNVEAGRKAAEHLMARGFGRYVFVGRLGFGFSIARLAGFSAALEAAGYAVEQVPVVDDSLVAWLSAVDEPVGVLATDDRVAQKLIDTASQAGVAVPEQVAVIGVDDDEFICEADPVPISSVDVRGEAVGYRAAELLDAMLHGEPAPAEPIIVPCGEVMTRRSTDTIAVADPAVRDAVRYIREHAYARMRIDDMMDGLRVSRRTLEKRFKAEFGRTLHDEVQRVRLDRARELLTRSDLNIDAIADRTGFSDRKWFSRAFRALTGMPPGRYRTAHRRP